MVKILMTNNKENVKKSWVTEGLVIASIPIVAYILTYQFEVGFTSVFKIPREFIKFDLTNILIVTIVLFTTILLVLPYFNFIFVILWSNRENPIYRSLIKVSLTKPPLS